MDHRTACVYLNGAIVPRAEAHLDIEDRGTMFADGVYEVLRYYNGLPLAMEGHVARLRHGLAELGIPWHPHIEALPDISGRLVERNALPDAKVYWQVSRGVQPRDHAAPEAGLVPTVLAMVYPAPPLEAPGDVPVVSAITREDPRWNRCDIKTLMLLPAVLAVHDARRQGAQTVILHRGGTVTEGAAANAAIVTGGRLVTHPADHHILPGITRQIVLELAPQAGVPVEERPFSLDELRAADEILLFGTTTHVAAVTTLDGQRLRAGVAGQVARRLHEAFVEQVRGACLVHGAGWTGG